MSEGRVPWKESNLALIGSDLDKKIKAAAAQGEAQWQDLESGGPGLHVWRIEQFKVVPWPQEKHGHFHKGDSYVVLNAYTKEDSDALLYDVHIWIGKESSQDEYGTAAYKMVEADDSVGGAAIQHRQVEGHESAMFLDYFGGSLTYLDGGVDTGFNIVEPSKDVPHLYKVKGTQRGMTMTQEALQKTSLNSGDSFILYANPSLVWIWHGASSNPDEKARANAQGEKMCTEGTCITLDQGQGDEDDADFWAYFEDNGDIAEADEADDEVEEFVPLLFKIPVPEEGGDDAEPQEPEQVAKAESVKQRFGPPVSKFDRALLDESGVFLLDAGWEVFLWMGKESCRDSKFAGMAHADSYMKEDPRTADLPLTIVKSGFENNDFSDFFE